MSILDERAAKAIQEAMDARVRALSVKSATSHMAEVIEIDAEGVTWVHIFGGADRTPATRTLAKVKKGDLVTVTIEEGAVTITGSPSSPSASVEYVDKANNEIVSYAKDAIAGILGDVIQVKSAIIERATIEDLTAVEATIETLTGDYARLNELVADKADIVDLTAATGRISQLEADDVTINGKITAAEGRIGTIESDYLKTQDMNAEVARVGTLLAGYAEADLANVNNAWIENGVIKDAAITNEMVGSLSANKLTAGTINGANINVTNLNADNITAGTINGQRIGQGSLSLDKLSESVYTESEVDSIVDGLNDRIDGVIETHTGTVVPTLNNSPASAWNTTDLKDEHVGDVYYVVNSQSQQNGYCYRFTKSGSSYSWQLIKDSDVTAALSRIQTAEGKITTFDSDISTLKTDTGVLKTKTQTLETSLGDKVDTSTFNELSSTVDENSSTITSMSTVLTNNGLTSSTNITQTVNSVSQTASSNSSVISQLASTLGTNADGTTKTGDVVQRMSSVEQDLDGYKTTVSNTYATQSALSTTNGNVTAAQTDATNALNRQTAYSATSSTGATTAAKVASCTNFPTLAAGATVTVRFSTANTSTGAITLNVNSTGAKTVYVNGAATSSSNQLLWAANANVTFTYDGTYWRVDSEPRSWYGTGSVAAATAAKTATINEIVVCKGTSVTLNMTYENTNTSATLNVTSTGAKNIYYGTTTTRPTTANGYGWGAGSTATFVFDGAYWRIGDTTALARLTTAEGVISSHTTSLEQTANAISAKADASDVYTKTQTDGLISTEVENRNAAITAKANEITSTVSQTYTTKTEFANLEIGGRNLLIGTADAKAVPASGSIDVELSEWAKANVLADDSLTVSFDAVAEASCYMDCYWRSSSTSYNNTSKFFPTFQVTTEKQHFEAVDVSGLDLSGILYLRFRTNSSPNGSASTSSAATITNLKLEKGNRATDWTPAHEDLETRVTAAESSITQNASNIALKVSESDVTGNYLVGKINLDATTATIAASKVNIEGAAIFTGNGRLSSTSLNNAYDSKGSASAAQSAAISAAASDATSKANAAQAAAISAAATDATNKANAANAQEQLIYCSKASGTTSLSANTTWVTATGDTQNAWTLRRPTYNQSYPVLFVATQRKTVGGTVTCTTPQIDNTTTVIDGGNIITGSVTANKLNAADINASNSLTVGAFTSAAQSDILNSNVQIGGRNLLRGSMTQDTSLGNYRNGATETTDKFLGCTVFKTSAAWDDIGFNFKTQLVDRGLLNAGDVLTYSIYAKTDDTTTREIYGVWIGNSAGGNHIGGTKIANLTSSWTRYQKQITVTQAMLDSATVGTSTRFECNTACTSGKYIYWAAPKIEKGNVATDWTPAPEDMASASDSVEYIVGTQTAATGSWTGVTRDSTLFTGKTIAYKLPYAGSGNASLQLKDSSGNNVGGNIAVYSMTTRVTTHYPANSIIQMTFDGSYWRTAGWYNTDTNARHTQYYNSILAGEALVTQSLIGAHEDGKYYQLSGSGDYFVLTAPLLWLTTALASGATNYANIYTQTYDRNLGTYYTSFAGGAVNSIVYLVGTVDGNKFILNGSTSADYLTCTEPTTANGLVYIPIGRLGNQSNGKNYFNFQVSVPVQLYAYKDGAFGPVSTREAAAVQANLNAETNQRKAVYGTCGTAAGTAAKVVTCSNFSLFTGVRIAVKFTTANTAAAPTLNVNSTTAKAVWNNNAVASASNPVLWGANATLTFVYDGTQWVLEDKAPTYSVACSTTASTQAKAPAVTGALVVNGTTLNVNFSTANTYASGAVQLNLSSTGAANVYKNNAVTSATNKLLWAANTTLTFTRVGQYWYVADSGLNKYVQHVDDNGIQVHPAASTADYALINANGMDVVKGNTSVAQFGSTARIGTAAGQNIKIDSDSIDICDGSTVKAYVDANGMTVNGKMSFRTVLYENTSGYNGTITLSDSAANYNHMRIHTKTNYGHGSVDVPNPNGKDILLLSMATDNSGTTTMYFIQQSRYISGTSFSVNHSGYAWMLSRSANSNNTSVNAENYMYVTRVEAWNE